MAMAVLPFIFNYPDEFMAASVRIVNADKSTSISASTAHSSHTDSSNCKCCCSSLLSFKHYSAYNLSCCFGLLYTRNEADILLAECESRLTYLTGDLSRVKVYGKWHSIPRQQCAYGEPGLTYTFSGVTLAAEPWPKFLNEIREKVSQICGCQFNFVLINRYRDGDDYIGEHRDDEKDLEPIAPIASLSLGRARDFVFRHESVKLKRKIQPPNTDKITIDLRHGCLLVMNRPTNNHWYHSLPPRKSLLGVRVNMTFRKMVKRNRR